MASGKWGLNAQQLFDVALHSSVARLQRRQLQLVIVRNTITSFPALVLQSSIIAVDWGEGSVALDFIIPVLVTQGFEGSCRPETPRCNGQPRKTTLLRTSPLQYRGQGLRCWQELRSLVLAEAAHGVQARSVIRRLRRYSTSSKGQGLAIPQGHSRHTRSR